VVLLLTFGVAVVGGTIVGFLARRWPAVQAPRVSGETIVKGVESHPRLAARLRTRFDPTKEAGKALTIATIAVAVAAVGVGLLAVTIRSKFGFSSVDARIARFAARHASSSATRVLKDISLVGGTVGVASIATVVTVIEYFRRPTRALFAFMFLVVGGQVALSNGIKFIVERARPDFDQLVGAAGTSFPSGHSTAAAATMAAIALIVTRGRARRTKVIAAGVAAGLAFMVACSRIFLGVHWFSDTLGGILLGWGWFAVCSIAFGGRLLEFGVPVVAAEQVAEAKPVEPDHSVSA
jgi:undecaprenyl-diphosphatase